MNNEQGSAIGEGARKVDIKANIAQASRSESKSDLEVG